MIPFSDEELVYPVKESLKNIIPYLEQDGGGLEFLGVKDAKVYVRLIGHCDGCPSALQTLKYGIERQLRVDIHPEMEVVNIPVGESFEL